jgi:hypothetical protein
MHHTDHACTKIPLSSIGVEHATELVRIEPDRYGINREVAPGEIFFD